MMLTNAEEKNQHKKSTLNMKSIYSPQTKKKSRDTFQNPTIQNHQKPILHMSHRFIHPPKKSIDFDYAPANNISQLISKGKKYFQLMPIDLSCKMWLHYIYATLTQIEYFPFLPAENQLRNFVPKKLSDYNIS